MTSKNDIAWARVFDELGLLEVLQRDGYVRIDASTLNDIGRREAQLVVSRSFCKIAEP